MPEVKTREQTKTETQKRYRPLHFQNRDHCTFCGAPMSASDTLCEECGMPVEGVACPTCGTLNFRTFCSKCNTPLTKAALRAVEKAKADPRVQQTAKLIDRAVELEEAIEATTDETEKEQIKEEHRHLVKDINQLFAEMLPPVESTPEEQFGYFSARKVAVETLKTVKREIPVGWVCNLCGCLHEKPSDCAEPGLGGTWIYETEEVTIVTKTYQYEE